MNDAWTLICRLTDWQQLPVCHFNVSVNLNVIGLSVAILLLFFTLAGPWPTAPPSPMTRRHTPFWRLKAGTHHPCLRSMFWIPVAVLKKTLHDNAFFQYGPWTRAVSNACPHYPLSRAVNTGSVYWALKTRFSSCLTGADLWFKGKGSRTGRNQGFGLGNWNPSAESAGEVW